MSTITTHVLDTARGKPAGGVQVVLSLRSPENGSFTEIGRGVTDGDGRLHALVPAGETPSPGVYRLQFDTGSYFRALGEVAFYPEVVVLFNVRDGAQRFHVPLLLAPYGYSTYRGS